MQRVICKGYFQIAYFFQTKLITLSLETHSFVLLLYQLNSHLHIYVIIFNILRGGIYMINFLKHFMFLNIIRLDNLHLRSSNGFKGSIWLMFLKRMFCHYVFTLHPFKCSIARLRAQSGFCAYVRLSFFCKSFLYTISSLEP